MGKKKKLGLEDLDKLFVYSTDPDANTQDDGDDYEEEIPEPSSQKLTVRRDKRHRKGKVVTLVQDYEGPDEVLEELGRSLKQYCGTGGSVKDGEIIIQGDNREKVKQFLEKEGYKVRLI